MLINRKLMLGSGVSKQVEGKASMR